MEGEYWPRQNGNTMDCGDNSCLFARIKGGMRTNGGCRCLDQLGVERKAQRVIKRWALEMVCKVKDLEAEIDNVQRALDRAEQSK